VADRYLISGATGLIGGRLSRAIRARDSEVCALSRSPERAQRKFGPGVEAIGWNGVDVSPNSLEGVRGVVHLAGEPVFAGPLTAKKRQRIARSRIDSTRSLVSAIDELPAKQRPRVLVCASAVGYYGSRGEEELSEKAVAGSGFLADVCRDWEAAAREAKGVRVVCLRIGIVLAREGGALPMMALPFRVGLGGRLGDGSQWVPWIHIDDLVGLIIAILGNENYSGPVNATSPAPARNRDLTTELARALRRPAFLPAPAFALRFALGDLAEELLASRRVIPKCARDRGYAFKHTSLSEALQAELQKPI